MTVDVEDAYGNLVTTDSSSVTLSLPTGLAGGTLGGTTTARASGGVATFAGLSITRTGNYTLRASDQSLAAASSGAFTITPAAASKLVFAQQPSSATAGATIAPVVTVNVEDAYGNLVTTDSSSVRLSLASGPAGAALSGTLTQKATGGVATFSTLIASSAGTYTLGATDGSLAAATSAAFSVKAMLNSSYATADSLGAMTATATISGSLSLANEINWFTFTLASPATAASKIQISFAGAAGQIGAAIYSDPAHKGAIVNGTSAANLTTLSLAGLSAGTYYLRVWGYSAISYAATITP